MRSGSNKLQKFLRQSSPTRIIVISFLCVITIGTVLLTLPFSSRSGSFTNPVNALFTATSATCVTGLSVYDTYGYWSDFGQAVILLLIQIGGLGFSTFATAFALLFRRKLGIRELSLVRESTGGSSLDVVSLLRVVVLFTLTVEAIGAGLLMLRFVPLYGGLGAWVSVFMSVSAFCNAGFDLLSFIPGNASLTAFNGDPLVTLTISALIITGSTGFVIFQDIYRKKMRPVFRRQPRGRLSFHSTVCLYATGVLLLLGTVLFFILEYNNTLRDMGFFEKLNAAFFQSVNTRTAGFMSVQIAEEKDLTKLLTIALMFIGGCPASIAGGVKVTTVVVLFAAVKSTLVGEEDTVLLRHRFDKSMVSKALTVVTLGLLIVALDTAVITGLHSSVEVIDALLESVSAFATVGLTAATTDKLGVISKLVLCATMFIGRVGPVSLGLAILMRDNKKNGVILPEGRMLIG
ncbi:MAG: hypothetical protein J6C51_02280 [Clostridia bacterium]|nr:hypothetical protein [Clostridia bacterium]